ncbi:MAG: hypothetical protein FWD47_09440 [Treponema sp.]|nr:hypothetical protein [Treponema sp.]
MKNQFKYTIKTGLHIRGHVFAVIFIMNTVFLLLGSLGLLPFAAKVTAVSLGGVAVAVMITANIISDIEIIRRTLFSQAAYLNALTPVPKWKTLLSSIVTIVVLDLFTMTFAITTQVWLALNLAGSGLNQLVWNTITMYSSSLYNFWFLIQMIANYILFVIIILFCIAAKKSIFYKTPASGLLVFLLALGCFYAISLLQLFLVPFASIQVIAFTIILSPTSPVIYPFYTILTLLEIIVLFYLTAKLLERKVNI